MTNRDILELEMQPSLDDFKKHLRITSSDLDDQLGMYLRAAAVNAEHFIGRCLEPSRLTHTGTFAQSIVLPMANADNFPVVEVAEVLVDGAEVTDFDINGDTLSFGESVSGDVVKIIYICGGNKVEDDIRAAILLTASKYFNNPVDSVEGMPSVATNLLSHYRTYGE